MVQMSDEEIDLYLRGQYSAIVGTRGHDGWAHLVPMSYGFWREQLAVVSFAKAQKVLNVRRDTRVTCLVDDGTDEYEKLRGAQIFGTGTILDEPEAVIEASIAILHHKIAVLGPGSVAPEEVAAQEERFVALASKRVVIMIDAQRVVSWDHRKLDVAY
jgi:nitroimidazol reductase NimA-like FMN-containing flavoprotein (pyridoxamine 5'-phosphate oxidase superfamily)